MSNQVFKELLQKYLEGKCTDEEKRLIDEWYDLVDEEPNDKLPEAAWDLKQEELWESIRQKAGVQERSDLHRIKVSGSWDRWGWVGVAASVVLAIGWLFLYGGGFMAGNEMVEVANTSSIAKQYVLQDGSQITIYPGSRIRFPAQATNGVREVFMEGEVFFEVKKDVSKPFLVYAGQVVTKVLGTSFTIKTQPDARAVEVAVQTGKVAVRKNDQREKTSGQWAQEEGVVLMPNQKANYKAANKDIVVGIVETPVNLYGPETGNAFFTYKEAPLAMVANSLAQAYGVEIIVSEKLRGCPITADFSQEPFFTKLSLICEALQAKYTVEGVRIVISGRGDD